LLRPVIGKKTFNLAQPVMDIVDEYIKAKTAAFDAFIQTCENLKKVSKSPSKAQEFILDLLAPNRDARMFEIVSFAILKSFYHDQKIFIGFDLEHLAEERLKLFKTGRTNANDGGIDFVMKPLGRFFQVTENVRCKEILLGHRQNRTLSDFVCNQIE
jgi:hypothetical protein